MRTKTATFGTLTQKLKTNKISSWKGEKCTAEFSTDNKNENVQLIFEHHHRFSYNIILHSSFTPYVNVMPNPLWHSFEENDI